MELGPGVSVFVGRNGAGKSSVIDAITFALFGEHSRGAAKNLVRTGQAGGYAEVVFSARGRRYRATRKVGPKGDAAARLEEHRDGSWAAISEGERASLGESTSAQVERIVGMGYKHLSASTIVKQGDLALVIDSQPKDLKEMLNSVIGTDRLDAAAENMGPAIRRFRDEVRGRLGRSYEEADAVRREAEEGEARAASEEARLEDLRSRRDAVRAEVDAATAAVEEGLAKQERARALDSKRAELVGHAKSAIASMRAEAERAEARVSECRRCLAALDGAAAARDGAASAARSIEASRRRRQELGEEIASLRERLDVAARLRVRDGRCPVCDSRVDSLNVLFDEARIRSRLGEAGSEAAAAEASAASCESRARELDGALRSAQQAEATLRAHSVRDGGDVDRMEREAAAAREGLSRIPAAAAAGAVTPEMAGIDGRAEALYREIVALEAGAAGFDAASFDRLRSGRDAKVRELGSVGEEIGAAQKQAALYREQAGRARGILGDLEAAAEYAASLESIRLKVFNRDGPVATSLRSWAMRNVSNGATSYLEMLDTKIQRIDMSEKARKVSITCYSGSDSMDMRSISGGEKACVALALRLGMARALGASSLGLVILDEPTAHMDSERRQSMVGVLSQLSSSSRDGDTQFLIISHDREVFDSAAVDAAYEFESGGAADGPTSVRRLRGAGAARGG